jgi:hypothetical protein
VDGWQPGVIDPDLEPPVFLAASYAEISPDGSEHYPVVVRKRARMHQEGPTLKATDLARIRARTLVMIADDDEGPAGTCDGHVRCHRRRRTRRRARHLAWAAGRETTGVQPGDPRLLDIGPGTDVRAYPAPSGRVAVLARPTAGHPSVESHFERSARWWPACAGPAASGADIHTRSPSALNWSVGFSPARVATVAEAIFSAPIAALIVVSPA